MKGSRFQLNFPAENKWITECRERTRKQNTRENVAETPSNEITTEYYITKTKRKPDTGQVFIKLTLPVVDRLDFICWQ